MATRTQARVAPWKKQEVEELTELLREHSVVGVARIDSLPSQQFQEVRATVRDQAQIRVGRNSLIERAIDTLEGDKEDLDDIKEFISGQTALILSDENPFNLFKTIEDSKQNAPANPGDVAPMDIWVEEGDTPFDPGPVVGDLQKAGLPAKIEGGKVVISEDELVAEEGDEIGADLADALSRLEIHPMIVGLDLRAVWEEGTVFDRDVLDVDEEAFVDDLTNAHARARSLAVEVAYPAASVLPELVSRSAGEARSLALEAEYPASDVVDEILSRGHAHAVSLAGELPEDALSDEALDQLGDAQAQPAPETEPDEDEDAEEAEAEEADDADEEDEEVSEEEAAEGLGEMFG
jgi:large subunit ribosomal protein L10